MNNPIVLGDLLAHGLSHNPDKIAIADGKVAYSFAQLENFANQLAVYLQAQGVQPQDKIAICAAKHCLMPVFAIAAWKIGAVYCPLDGQMPADRLTQILTRLQPAVVFSLVDNQPVAGHQWVEKAQFEQLINGNSDVTTVTNYQHQADETAYIIFTSGSTGTPKGVQITTENLADYFVAHNEVLQFTPDSRVFSLSPFHFDVSIEDTLLPLHLGAYVFQFNKIHAGKIICNNLIKQQATHLIAVSTLLTMLSSDETKITRENFPKLEMVMTGAEVCAPKVINLWKNALPEVRVINAYGPTEVTIVCSCYTIEHAQTDRVEPYPIGKALTGVEVMIVDEQGNQVAQGQSGELCLGGSQVMKGYFGQPEQTDARIFVHQGVRYYRSGDVCYVDENDNICFVGRNDNEVKINGFRIHLGEIQQQCLAVQGVERATIGVVEHQDNKHIAAVIVADQKDKLQQVESHLQNQLPVYMRPIIWGYSDEVSLSASGKTDDKALIEQLSNAFVGSNQRYFVRQDAEFTHQNA